MVKKWKSIYWFDGDCPDVGNRNSLHYGRQINVQITSEAGRKSLRCTEVESAMTDPEKGFRGSNPFSNEKNQYFSNGIILCGLSPHYSAVFKTQNLV